MFQDFDAPSSPDTASPRVQALRDVMQHKGVDGVIVPRSDAHQGEYVADCDQRLAWLTGFTGSAGFAVILNQSAGVFIDGRYRLQVRDQCNMDLFTPVNWPETHLADWLMDAMPEGGVVAYDPWLHSIQEITTLLGRLAGSGITLIASDNMVDEVWTDRPAPPKEPVIVHPLEFAGIDHAAKRAKCATTLANQGAECAVLTLPDSICWLLNIRGNDLPRVPVALCFALLYKDGSVDLFVDADKLDVTTRDHLGADVRLHATEEFEAALSDLNGPVLIDQATAPNAVALALEMAGNDAILGQDPCVMPKACKNDIELEGARAAHLRDAAAMVEFLAWLDLEAPSGTLTEIEIVQALEGFRNQTNVLRDISFDTICGTGGNGAIVHYRVTHGTNRLLQQDTFLLVDSGGQYQDGTTDITRTIAIGNVSDEARACFTRVLQGMINISRLRFPKGLSGRDIDVLARVPLWLAGQDYDHGTGHGVGSYLSVHEGPQRISRVSEVALKPGMILSNEPGYYREGEFGIRLENLIVVQSATQLQGGDGREMLGFETLTYVPIDHRAIDTKGLDADAIEWLNAYHEKCRSLIGPRLSEAAKAWLEQATAPI